jgi:hypothetical protein
MVLGDGQRLDRNRAEFSRRSDEHQATRISERLNRLEKPDRHARVPTIEIIQAARRSAPRQMEKTGRLKGSQVALQSGSIFEISLDEGIAWPTGWTSSSHDLNGRADRSIRDQLGQKMPAEKARATRNQPARHPRISRPNGNEDQQTRQARHRRKDDAGP